jgi:hypothetical protein
MYDANAHVIAVVYVYSMYYVPSQKGDLKMLGTFVVPSVTTSCYVDCKIKTNILTEKDVFFGKN